jgi:simple sugar transport system permease protein
MTELAPALSPGPPRARALVAILGPIASIVVCLALTAVVLAALPPTAHDAPHTFGESLAIIGRTVRDRVLLPRSPRMDAGYRNWIETLQSATPILLTGLAVAVAFRANVLNIGGQGQYVAGAIAATAVAVYLPPTTPLLIPLHLAAALLAGALFASLAAALDVWRSVPVVLSTLLLNFVAIEFLRYLLQGPMRAVGDPGAFVDPQSRQFPESAQLPEFFSDTPGEGLQLGFFLALAAALLLWFLLRQTTFGFRLRVVGQNPVAARFAGMNVARVSFATLALSGALAGLGGGVQVAGVATYVLFPDLGTDGLGFTGIAVALLGRLSPVGVVFSALFFGLLDTTFKALERSPLAIHSVTAQAVQGALVIAILIVTSPQWSKSLRGVRFRPHDSKHRPDL